MIRVLVKEPGKDAEVREVNDDLESLQQIVAGYIEGFNLPDCDAQGYCNEEGLLLNLKPNIYRPAYKDAIVGPIVFVNYNDEGDACSLTDEQIHRLRKYLKQNEVKSTNMFLLHIQTNFKYYDFLEH